MVRAHVSGLAGTSESMIVIYGKFMIDVVIVNWNAGDQLIRCVESVLQHDSDVVARIIVVDNDSKDGSDASIEKRTDITLIRTGQNLGFGKACNLGAQQGSAEYLLFLNPDAALYPDTLLKMLEFMQNPSNASIGICGAQLIDETDHVARSCSRFPSVKSFCAHSLGFDRCFPTLGHAMTEWNHLDTREVDQIIGACFLVRRSLFNSLSGFDERFFVYFEEVDFSRRAYLLGWHSMYLADAQAFHAGGGTSRQIKARRLFYSLRSRLLYSHKHFSRWEAALVVLATLLLEPVSRSVLAIARRSWSSIREIWLAYGMLWCWLPQWVFRGSTR